MNDYHASFATLTTMSTTFLTISAADILTKCLLAVLTGVITWCVTTILNHYYKKNK